MSVVCEDIPNTDEVKKSLHGNVPSLVRIRYIGESKIPGIDATKLAPCVLPVFYKKYADEIESFKVYEDDVWITSYPKCGTTWAQEMVWLIVNNLDFNRAKTTHITKRYGFIEQSGILSNLDWKIDTSSVEYAKSLSRPRFIKSHLPIALLPTEFWTAKPKLVYITRNPKDAAISYYHHYVNLHHFKGSMNDFLDSFLNDLVCWSPFSDHVVDYWKLRNESNILFITYEDMSNDLNGILRKVAKFFDKNYNDTQLKQLEQHLSFNEMKTNNSVNYEKSVESLEILYGKKRPDLSYCFLRRGEINSARDEMPAEYQKKFDEWEAAAFKACDFKFKV